MRELVLAAVLCAATAVGASGAEEGLIASEGVFLEERSKLATNVMELGREGVGIAAFKQAFARIEQSVHDGVDAAEVRQQIDRLQRAVSEQERFVYVPPSPAKQQEQLKLRAAYLAPAEKALRAKIGVIPGLKSEASFHARIGLDGKITKITDDSISADDDLESRQTLSAARSKLAALQLPKPTKPVDVVIVLYKNAQQHEVVSADIDYKLYMANLQRRMKRNWNPPTVEHTRHCVVRFYVHQDGQVTGLRIHRGSGIPEVDQSCLKAVNKSAPFRPLPAGSPEHVFIDFTFDYNVWKDGQLHQEKAPT